MRKRTVAWTPNARKLSMFIAVFALVQLFLCGALAVLLLADGANSAIEQVLVLASVGALLVTMATIARYVAQHVQMQRQYEALTKAFELLEQLNGKLRAQRHDFMNHLQVVYGLMELEDGQSAVAYMQRLFGELNRDGQQPRTDNPAVNALLMAKRAEAEARGVAFHTVLNTPLTKPGVPSWELCAALGNLIDNALEALALREGDRELQVAFSEDLKGYRFTVGNNGPAVAPELRERIFEPGVSTKGGAGERGMGLALVRSTMERYGGSIAVNSSEEWTAFTGWMPRG